MKNLGPLLRTLREEKSLSRSELAEGVCTEKYLYLIEKGERTPSADVLRSLSQTLKVDLFQYYRFFNCQDPLAMTQIMSEFAIAQRRGDLKLHVEIILKAQELQDFKRKPWSYILDAHLISYNLLTYTDIPASYQKIRKLINEMESIYLEAPHVAPLYLVYSIALQHYYNFGEAYQYALKAENIFADNLDFFYNDTPYMQAEAKSSTLICLYRMKQYEKIIEQGEEFVEFLAKSGTYSRMETILAFLAFSYQKLGRNQEAIRRFKHSLQILMLTNNRFFIDFLSAEEGFTTMKSLMPKSDYIFQEFESFEQKYANKTGTGILHRL